MGNVTSQTDKDSKVTSYTYDDVYRLTHVDYPSGSDYGYEYDAVGNRTKMLEYLTSSTITTVYTYDAADELTQYTTSTVTMTFGYASDGCLTTKSDGSDTWSYEWDYERRLAGFKKNGSTLVEYAYNPTGTRRYASDATLGVTNYFWSRGHVLGDYNSSWSLTRSYILGPRVDEIIAMIDRTTDPNLSYYFMKNRLGSTHNVLDSSQAVVTSYRYDVWGAPSETHIVGSVSTRYLGGGDEYDWQTQAYFYGAGWASPTIGRGLQPRPPQSQSNMFGVIGPYDPRHNGWAGADEVMPWWPWPISCFGYCETILHECRQRCEMDLHCDRNWLKAIGYRCCQCYFKRCYTACLGGSEGGEFTYRYGRQSGKYMAGPPLRCKNDVSIEECHHACWARNWKPPSGPPGKDEPCWDEGGRSYWFNVCQNNSLTWEEWGQTVPLSAQSQTDSTPKPLRGYSRPCRRCFYAEGIGDLFVPLSLGFSIYVNAWEQCPIRAPKYQRAGYGRKAGIFGYFRHWPMINSCGPSFIPLSDDGLGVLK